MEYDRSIEDVVRVVEAVGAAIMVVGGLGAFLVFLFRVVPPGGARAGSYEELRRNLGRAILLGLEVLIVADIVRTIVIDQTVEMLSAASINICSTPGVISTR